MKIATACIFALWLVIAPVYADSAFIAPPCQAFGTTSGTCLQGAGALGSPLSIGTLPAFTQGGTISGGGNQLNNIIIGTATPLAGTFTALTANTSGAISPITGQATPATFLGTVQIGPAAGSSLASAGGIELQVADGYGVKIQQISAGGSALLFGIRNASAGWTEAVRISISGGLSIGSTTDPGIGSLQVNSTIFAPNMATTTGALGAALCWTTTTGQFQRDTNAGGCLVSNAASKHAFERLDLNKSYETVMAAEPYSFVYNDNEVIGRQIGFKADDFVNLDNRLVGFDADGNVQTFRYQQYTAELTAAFQHRASIDDKRYQELKADNDSLRACQASWKCLIFGVR